MGASRKSAYAALTAFEHTYTANSIAPEYLIVEPTGVGYLSNVINNISQIEYEQIES